MSQSASRSEARDTVSSECSLLADSCHVLRFVVRIGSSGPFFLYRVMAKRSTEKARANLSYPVEPTLHFVVVSGRGGKLPRKLKRDTWRVALIT